MLSRGQFCGVDYNPGAEFKILALIKKKISKELWNQLIIKRLFHPNTKSTQLKNMSEGFIYICLKSTEIRKQENVIILNCKNVSNKRYLNSRKMSQIFHVEFILRLLSLIF